jgi:hypothetical protein
MRSRCRRNFICFDAFGLRSFRGDLEPRQGSFSTTKHAKARTLGETLTVDRRLLFTIPTNWRPNGRQDFQDSMREQARTHGDGGIDAGTKDPIGHPYRTTRNYIVDGPVGLRGVDER